MERLVRPQTEKKTVHGPKVTSMLNAIETRLAIGEVITSHESLAEEFEINHKTVYKAIREAGLQGKIAESKRRAKESLEIVPSQEYAQLLGMMVGRGRTALHRGYTIVFTHPEEDVLESFKTKGEHLFGLTGFRRRVEKDRGNEAIIFNSRTHARLLGDFRSQQKDITIREKHPWVFEEDYVNYYASGLIDATGSAYLTSTKRAVEFFTVYPNIAELHHEMLIRMDMKQPKIIHGKHSHYEVQGAGIYNIPDVRSFANKVTSLRPHIQAKLEQMKTLEKKKAGRKPKNDTQ